MANYAAAVAVHETLTASTVDEVTLTAPITEVTVLNRTGAAEIYFTAGSGNSPPAAPTVAGGNCYVVPAALGSLTVQVNYGFSPGNPCLVYLISAAAESYSVEAL